MSKVEKSRKKTGGRKKGTPNKKTQEFIEQLGDFKTVEEMKNLYYITDKQDIKFAICKEFLKYEFPQRKAVDMSANVELDNDPLEVRFI